ATGRRPMAFRLVHRVPVDLKKCAAGVGRVKLHTVKGFALVFPGETDVEGGGSSLARELGFVRIALADDHVAAVAAASLQIPSGGGVFSDWCHDFEEIAGHREKRVFETEGRHGGILETNVEPEDSFEIGDHRCEFFRNQAD